MLKERRQITEISNLEAPSREVAGTRRPSFPVLDRRSKMLQPPLLVPVSSRWGWRGWLEMLLACDLSRRW